MSELMLTILDSRRSIHGTIHGSVVDAAVAALSADPETIEELQAALGRFLELSGDAGVFDCWEAGVCDTPWDAGLCIIDLAARLVLSRSSYSAHGHSGEVAYHDGRGASDVWLPYQLSDEWMFSEPDDGWEELARRRRAERESVRPLDAREVLYGKVAEFVASQCLAAASQPAQPEDVFAEIHARWLMTPREDLRNQSPRDVLLARRDFIDGDLQDRCDQWSRLGDCPPGLGADSAAFRFAGFGTHENVLYYELVRELLADCWERVAVEPGRALAAETAAVQRRQETWLTTPQESLHGYSPNEAIERERLRLPLAVSGDEAVIDHDCPLCQMMAEDLGPMFLHLDGCNMDCDFPFSFYRSREEWEAERAEWETLDREFEEEWRRQESAERQTNDTGRAAPAIWQRSYSDSAAREQGPLAVQVFGIGAHLAELIVGVRRSPQGAAAGFVETLNRDFGNLRASLRGPSDALVEPVVARFHRDLDDVAVACPDLAPQIADLRQQLGRVAQRVTAETGHGDPDD